MKTSNGFPCWPIRFCLKKIGPGIVLSASIVGSGELIATTTLGAQAGYVALWVVLLSCAVKPAVQAELGRYTIATGETGLEALVRPRVRVPHDLDLTASHVAYTHTRHVGAARKAAPPRWRR